MGLDLMDMVMCVEERFKISLFDREVGGLDTVGDLYHTVRFKLGHAPGCPAAAFYRIRRAMVSALGVARSDVRPATRLEEILPRRGRRAAWTTLAQIMQLRLPKLRRPARVSRAIWTLGSLVLIVPPVVYTIVSWSHLRPIDWSFNVFAMSLFLLLPFTLVTYIAFTVTDFLCDEIAPECDTVAALARTVVLHNAMAFAPDPQVDISDPVWQSLVEIITRCTGVKPDRVTPEAEFVRDLGC